MTNMIEFEGRMYRSITKEDVSGLVGKMVLVCSTHIDRRALVRFKSVESTETGFSVMYEYQTPWHTLCGFQSWDTEYPTYYIEGYSNESLCYCAGPVEDRWCYDTNKMEPICCRCKKRKTQ